MSQKIALVVSAALTVFVIVVAGALAARLGHGGLDEAASVASPQAPLEVSQAAMGTVPTDIVLRRDQQYQEQIEAAQGRLRQVDAHVRRLQVRLQELQGQNATLLDREQTYQQRLQEANRSLQRLAPDAPADLSGPAGYVREATRAADVKAMTYGEAKKRDRQRHQDHAHKDHGRDGEDDDD